MAWAIVAIAVGAFWIGRSSGGPASGSISRSKRASDVPSVTKPVTANPPVAPLVAGPNSPVDEDWSQFALLLVDVQNDFLTQDMEARHTDYANNVAELLVVCREQGIEVIHLRTEFTPSTELSAAYQIIFSQHLPCMAGSLGVLAPAFAVEFPGERIFRKTNFNGFTVDGLTRYLDARGKKHVLLAGMTTDLCVLATALGAVDKGFVVSVVADCCLSSSDPAHSFVLNHYDGFLFDTVSHLALKHRRRQWLDQLKLIKP